MVQFSQIPSDNLVPGAYAEFDASGALQGTPTKPQRVALIGLVPSSSSIQNDTPIEVSNAGKVLQLAGASQLATIAEAFMRIKRDFPIDVFAVEEASGGAASKASLQLSGSATENGTLPIYINGKRIPVAVQSGDTASNIQSAAITAINNAATGRYKWLMPVTASDNAGTMEVTADFKGVEGDDMTFSVPNDELPAGVTISTETDFTGGSGNVDLANSIAAFGDTMYSHIVSGITDDSNVGKLETELQKRWGPMDYRDGLAFVGITGTQSDHTTYAGNRNSQYVSVMGAGQSPTPPWVWGAQAAARDAMLGWSPRPRFGLSLPDCEPPPRDSEFDRDERQLLLEAGISTYRVTPGGRITTERLITTYTQDPQTSTPDPVFRNVSTMRNLSYLRWSWVTRAERKYQDANVADDGTQVGPGVKVVTPSDIRGEALVWFREMERAGRVEDFEQFKAQLVAMRDPNDPERINTIHPPDLINELVTIASLFAFRY
jgi:phage tail sheath gpL-like